MLSIIVYGRNDQHGYHYSKRFAISLNCIAETLTHEGDEILFVDYNTPDDTPTIVEALQDTLTDRSKSLLRISRVRPKYHPSKKTDLPICEPLARNVALRCSNPNNKWILSTNIDMIFVPENPKLSLSDLVTDLSDGFYQLPRFELPENLWELEFDRSNPQENIEFLREYADALHLKTIVRRPGFLMFDNPGDFQLMLRNDIFRIGGFDESMLLGWHVDSNLAKRFALLYENKSQSLEGKIDGYHCNHNKQTTHFHDKLLIENDWNRFVHSVSTPFLPHQSENWGLKDEKIEKIAVNANSFHKLAISNCLKPFEKKTAEILLDLSSYNTTTYSTPRIFSYLVDHICTLSKEHSNIAYFGYNSDLLALLRNYFQERSFSEKISQLKDHYPPSETSLCIFDFGFDESLQKSYSEARKDLTKIVKLFLKVSKDKKRNMKIIGINIQHTDFRFLFHKHLATITNSSVTGISYGYIRTKNKRKKRTSLKKRFIFLGLYFFTRYWNKHTDKIRNLLLHSKILKKFTRN